MLDTDDIVDGTTLMMRTAPNVHGRVAQVVACLSWACEGVGCVAVVFAEYIDSHIEVEHAPQHGDAPSVAESNTHTPTIETDVDVPVAEVTEAVKITPSIVESGSYDAHATTAPKTNALSSAYMVRLLCRRQVGFGYFAFNASTSIDTTSHAQVMPTC